MHPSVVPEQSSGGGAPQNTLLTEDWVLRYPKCTGSLAVKCSAIPEGTYCNNCGWANGNDRMMCNDTLAHEFGHTIDLHSQMLKPSLTDIANTFDNPIERPAWAGATWFMNPGDEGGGKRSNLQSKHYSYLNTGQYLRSVPAPRWLFC